MDIKSLYTERARAWATAEELRARVNAEGFDATKDSDVTVSYNRALDDVQSLSDRIETEERAEKMSGKLGHSGGNQDPKREDRKESTDDEYREAFYDYLQRGTEASPESRRLVAEKRAAVGNWTGDGTSGFLIPVTTLNKMTESLKAFGGILNEAEIIETATGNTVNWPTNDDTANKGNIVGEAGGPTTMSKTVETFGQKSFGAYIYSSNIVQISWPLLQDNIFNVESFVARKLGERIGRILADHLAVGTGSSQPQGLFTGANVGVTGATGTATGITYAGLVDLQHSVDPAYRQAGNCRYVFNDNTLKGIRKLVNSVTGTPLWEPSVQAGVPSTILGQPYTVDQSVVDPANAARYAGYGDVREAYLVRRVAGGSMVRLGELYAEQMTTGFFSLLRFNAMTQNANAFKVFVGTT